MEQNLIIETLRKELVSGIVKLIDNETTYVRLFHVNDDLTLKQGPSKYAGRVSVIINVKDICRSNRYIIFTLKFDKYEIEEILYTPITYSIKQIIDSFFHQMSVNVKQTFIDNNDFVTVKEINAKTGLVAAINKLPDLNKPI